MGRPRKIIIDKTKLNVRADETILEDEEKLTKDIEAIKNVLYNNKELVSLSAPQIGINSRMFCIKFANGDIRTFINPMIIHTEGGHLSRETCASIPDKEFIVVRSNKIEATYQTPMGVVETNMFEGAPCEVFQQMVHLLDGVLIDDIGLELIEGWDESTDSEREEVINMYLDSLKSRSEELHNEISSTPALKELDDAIEFMTGVATGKVKLEDEEPKLNRAQRRLRDKLERKFNKRKVVKNGN